MKTRHVFRELMTRYPANGRQERRQLIFLIAAGLLLSLTMLMSLFI
jgi:hypothetical protein